MKKDLTVVVTRAKAQAAGLVTLLRARSFEVLELPALNIEYSKLSDELRDALDDLQDQEYSWVVFLSANGVRGLAHLYQEAKLPPVIPDNVRIAAQGAKTALVCSQLFKRTPVLVPEEALAEQLARNLLEQVAPDEKLLLAVSEESRGFLQAELRKASIEFDEIVVYKNRRELGEKQRIPEVVTSEKKLVFSFFSPSAVKSVWEGLGEHREVLRRSKIAVIGPVTAQAVRDLGLPVFLEARDHSDKGFVEALCAALDVP